MLEDSFKSKILTFEHVWVMSEERVNMVALWTCNVILKAGIHISITQRPIYDPLRMCFHFEVV